MGFCFPGHDAAGGDLPPRRECVQAWHARLFAAMPQLELMLAVGSYAQRWHLGAMARGSMTETVKRWRELLECSARPRRVALPHPSWRNNAWLAANPWFDASCCRACAARSANCCRGCPGVSDPLGPTPCLIPGW